jgi:hypothetical protein
MSGFEWLGTRFKVVDMVGEGAFAKVREEREEREERNVSFICIANT